MPSFTVKKMDR